jgi:hypothetical protein
MTRGPFLQALLLTVSIEPLPLRCIGFSYADCSGSLHAQRFATDPNFGGAEVADVI